MSTVYNRYILNEANSALAIEQGLAEADWYTSPIPKSELRKFLERRDGPAIRDTLIWFSNKGQDDARNGQPLEPGIYGLSNALLDAPWPKVLKTKAQFASLLCLGAPDEAFFEMLADTTTAPDMRLPETGVPLDLERMLSAVRIESPCYGTRTSTVDKLYTDAPGTLHEMLIH